MTRMNGFTLIEILAALLAGSIILVTLSWSIALLGKMYAESGNLEPEARFAAASDALELLVEPIRPGSARFEDRHLEAVTSPPMAAGPVGPVKLELSVASTRAGQALIARIQPESEKLTMTPSMRSPQILLSGMRSVRFDYGEEDSRTGLPRSVNIRVRDADKRERQISIIPRLTSDGSCRYDPITLSCR